MKSLLFLSMVSMAAFGSEMLPTATQWAQGMDTRPEAILTGGALLLLAALLRRKVPSIRAR